MRRVKRIASEACEGESKDDGELGCDDDDDDDDDDDNDDDDDGCEGGSRMSVAPNAATARCTGRLGPS